MDTLNNNQTNFKSNGPSTRSHVGDAAEDLLVEGKKLADELYKDGVNKVSKVEDEVKEYSDELLRKVQENPLTAVLIAGGIGFLLSTIFKK